MTNCPECKQPAISIGQKHIIDPEDQTPEGRAGSYQEVFRCPTKCTQKVPYPGKPGGGDSDWPIEFYIDAAGQTQLLRPAADWFA